MHCVAAAILRQSYQIFDSQSRWHSATKFAEHNVSKFISSDILAVNVKSSSTFAADYVHFERAKLLAQAHECVDPGQSCVSHTRRNLWATTVAQIHTFS